MADKVKVLRMSAFSRGEQKQIVDEYIRTRGGGKGGAAFSRAHQHLSTNQDILMKITDSLGLTKEGVRVSAEDLKESKEVVRKEKDDDKIEKTVDKVLGDEKEPEQKKDEKEPEGDSKEPEVSEDDQLINAISDRLKAG